MKSKLSNENTGLAAEDQFMASLTWLSQKPAVAMFEDHGTLSENSALELLPADERTKAATIAEPDDKRHFVLRRCFQRCFLKTVTHFPHAIGLLEIVHARDTRPFCPGFQGLSLSFSSSGNLAIAAASDVSHIGVDIERVRHIGNSADLAARFFQPNEAAYLKSVPESQRDTAFLTFWAIKEACLKATGKGIVYGLDKFAISRFEKTYHIVPPKEFGHSKNWQLTLPTPPPDHILAIVRYTPS